MAERVKPWFAVRGDQTLRQEYDLDADSLVLDVGGYEGQWASDIFGRYACPILIFEPMPDFARQIGSRFERNPKIEVLPFGLGAKDERMRLSVSADASSVFKHDAQGVEIELREADRFLRQRGIVDIALMKVNIEGGEYDLLDHLLETGWIERIRDLQVQFHDFVPNADVRMKSIQSRLERTHQTTYQYEFVWENWRRR